VTNEKWHFWRQNPLEPNCRVVLLQQADENRRIDSRNSRTVRQVVLHSVADTYDVK